MLDAFRVRRRCASVGRGLQVTGSVWVHGAGAVRIGDHVLLDAAAAPIELHALRGGELIIGDGAVIEGGVSLEATERVSIGARCRVGAFSKVMDNDFHRPGARRSERPPSAPVVVEDGAVLGPRAILLAGARVEQGERIAAGGVRGARRRR